MPRAYFIVFDDAHDLTDSVSFATRPFSLGFIQRKQPCFDFFRFDTGVDPTRVTDDRSVVATTIAAATVQDEVTALFNGPHAHATVAYALLPKVTGGWITMRTGTYTPDLHRSAEKMDFVSQARVLSALFDEAIEANCRLFVGPEAVVYKGAGSGNKKIPFSSDERDEIIGILANKTADRQMALFIPGTLWWQDAGGNVHNSLIAFSEGQALDIEYDKKEWTGEELAEAQSIGGPPVVGAHPYCFFTWKGLDIAVQICQDSATALNRRVAIHIILGWGTGHYTLKQRSGGVGVYADAKGYGRVQDEFGTYDLGTTPAGTIRVTEATLAVTPSAL